MIEWFRHEAERQGEQGMGGERREVRNKEGVKRRGGRQGKKVEGRKEGREESRTKMRERRERLEERRNEERGRERVEKERTMSEGKKVK